MKWNFKIRSLISSIIIWLVQFQKCLIYLMCGFWLRLCHIAKICHLFSMQLALHSYLISLIQAADISILSTFNLIILSSQTPLTSKSKINSLLAAHLLISLAQQIILLVCLLLCKYKRKYYVIQIWYIYLYYSDHFH